MTDSLGTNGEKRAEVYLRRRGYRIVEKNYRCRLGEIDLIAFKDKTIVFCEVKTRNNKEYGEPYESVTRHKQERLRLLAEIYLQKTKRYDFDCRFDVISILLGLHGRVKELIHIKNAF